jgi:hypothetical protein
MSAGAVAVVARQPYVAGELSAPAAAAAAAAAAIVPGGRAGRASMRSSVQAYGSNHSTKTVVQKIVQGWSENCRYLLRLMLGIMLGKVWRKHDTSPLLLLLLQLLLLLLLMLLLLLLLLLLMLG